jgi:glucans biosynthesis protein C
MIQPIASASDKPRAAFIDHIRVALTVLVIWHHSAIMFGGPGGWYLRNPVDGKLTEVLFTLMCSVDQAFFMGAFFLFSGYFTPRAFDSKGIAKFALDRFLRLGVPLLVYGFLIGPMTVALSAHVKGAPFWSTWLQFLSEPRFDIGPLWFAYALLLFNIGYVLWRWLRPCESTYAASGAQSASLLTHGRLAAAVVVTAAAAFALRLWHPVGSQWWGCRLAIFPPTSCCLSQAAGWRATVV